MNQITDRIVCLERNNEDCDRQNIDKRIPYGDKSGVILSDWLEIFGKLFGVNSYAFEKNSEFLNNKREANSRNKGCYTGSSVSVSIIFNIYRRFYFSQRDSFYLWFEIFPKGWIVEASLKRALYEV